MVGQSYDVQWGRASQISSADIVASGSDEEMKVLLLQRSQAADPTPQTPQTEEENVPKPVPKRRRILQTPQPAGKNVPKPAPKRRPPQSKVGIFILIVSSKSPYGCSKNNNFPTSSCKTYQLLFHL